jgi:adenylate cyclase
VRRARHSRAAALLRLLTRPLRRIGSGRIIGLLLLFDCILVRSWDPALVEALRNKTFDFYQVLLPRTVMTDEVVIVDIDEESLTVIGQWPWPRTTVADLVDSIARQGARVIGFDVLFPERDRTSPAEIAETARGLEPATQRILRALPSNDDILAAAFRRTSIVLGQSGYRTIAVDDLSEPPHQTGLAVVGPDPGLFAVSFPYLLHNLPPLEAAAKGRGLFSFKPDPDGVLRRVPLIAKVDTVTIPSLALEMLRVDRDSGAVMVRSDVHGIRSVGLQDITVPTDWRGRAWIRFAPHDPSRFVSAIQVLRGHTPPDRLQGKLVLVGTSAVGLLDLKATPIDPAMPGVEVHAQIIDNMLTGAVLKRPIYATGLEYGVTLLLSLLLIALGPVIPAGLLFLLGGVVAFAVAGFTWISFASFGYLVDCTFPLVTSLSVYAIVVATNYLRASSDRYWIRSAFSQYISPALVEQLARSPDKLILGGERRNMTVMFSDVRGFTAISEGYKDDPQGLTTLLNRVLTPLTTSIIERKGTIDKYIGDGVMAFWNAPVEDSDHEANACAAALEMLSQVEAVNAERAREAEAAGAECLPLRIGIGINTGTCYVGNFGSDLHFNYSVLGDTVNVSSRLESQSKTYCVPTVIGERTAQAVADRYAVFELDLLQVAGKSEPERIFTILGAKELRKRPSFTQLAAKQQEALSAYRRRDWAGALQAILLCRELGRGYALEEYYAGFVNRIRELIEKPPPEDWAGVTVLSSK